MKYNQYGVPQIQIGSSGGGSGSLVDVSDTTAVPAAVASGYVFHTSDGTLTAGNMSALQQTSYMPTTSTLIIQSGVYLNGQQVIAGDANLVGSNIRSGISLFGVSGTASGGVDVSDTTATDHYVLSGYYFYTSDGVRTQGMINTVAPEQHPAPTIIIDSSTGIISASYQPVLGYTMAASPVSSTYSLTTKQSGTYTPEMYDQIIASSGEYMLGDQVMQGDMNLVGSNIRSGVYIFGVSGTMDSGIDVSSTTATSDSVLQGYQFFDSTGNLVYGTIPTSSFYNPQVWLDSSVGQIRASYSAGQGYYQYGGTFSSSVAIPMSSFSNPEVGYNSMTGQVSARYSAGSGYYASGGEYTSELQLPVVTTMPPTIQVNNFGEIDAYYTASSGFVNSTEEHHATYTLGTTGGQTIVPSQYGQQIMSGVYITSTIYIQGDMNLSAQNIRSGCTIFGVMGSLVSGVDVSDTTADQYGVLYGYYFYDSNGNYTMGRLASTYQPDPQLAILSTGVVQAYYTTSEGYTTGGTYMYSSMQLNTTGGQWICPNSNGTVISSGYYITGDINILGDSNLSPQNIRSGVTIFGVTGTYTGE